MDAASVVEPAVEVLDSELKVAGVSVVEVDPSVDDSKSPSADEVADVVADAVADAVADEVANEEVDAEEPAVVEAEEEDVVVLPVLLPPSRGMQSSVVMSSRLWLAVWREQNHIPRSNHLL